MAGSFESPVRENWYTVPMHCYVQVTGRHLVGMFIWFVLFVWFLG